MFYSGARWYYSIVDTLAKTVASSDIKTRFAGIRLGIVCPMANEAATAIRFVDAVLDECANQPFQSVIFFAVVDHVSRDDTRALLERHQARRPQLRVVWAPETQGVADAYVRGYREALAADCDWILEIDAGFSHEPSDISRFLEAMTDQTDCIFGSRFLEGGKNRGTFQRRLISRGGTVLTNLLLGTTLSDMTSGFQLFSREALTAALARGISSKGPFFQTELKFHCRNLRVVEIPIQYNAASHSVGREALRESLINLYRLARHRVAGDA